MHVTKVSSSDPQEDNRHQTTCCSRSEVQEQLSFKVVDSIWFFKIKRDDDLVWFLDFEIGGNVVIRDFLRRKLWTRGLDGKFMVLWRVMASSHRARKRQKCAIFNSLPNQNEKVSQSVISLLSLCLSLSLSCSFDREGNFLVPKKHSSEDWLLTFDPKDTSHGDIQPTVMTSHQS